MRSGRLRHRIVIQQTAITRDSYGQAVEGWSTFATRWASVEPLKGKELFAAQQVNAETTVRIRLRYLSGLTQSMRISFDSRIYNIVSIATRNEVHHEMELMCSEGLNDG